MKTENAVLKTPQRWLERKFRKKCLSEEALQIAVKRREAKSKGDKERYTHLFEYRVDKKAFLSDQYKEIEENNRMGKTRDLFKKIRNTKVHESRQIGSGQTGDGKSERQHFMKRWAQ